MLERAMNVTNIPMTGFLCGMLLTACSNTIPVVINPYTLAYAVLDDDGKPTRLCFDTISPNNCIDASDEALKRYEIKKRILSKEYIVILGEPSQVDCKKDSPTNCRVYFEHIYIDISVHPDDIKILEEEFKETQI